MSWRGAFRTALPPALIALAMTLLRLAGEFPEIARIGRLCSEIGRDREAKAWLSLALKYDPKSEAIRSELDTLDRTR